MYARPNALISEFGSDPIKVFCNTLHDWVVRLRGAGARGDA